MDIVERLEKAAAAGEILEVIYHGGSQAGAVRKLAPIRVTGNKFHAKCMETNRFKYYMVEKVELVGEETHLPDDWQPDVHRGYDPSKARDSVVFSDLLEYTSTHTKRFSNAGWIVADELNSIEVDGQTFVFGTYGLHNTFKNGKPKKRPEVVLYSQPFEDELGQFPSDKSTEVYLKPRPYSVYGPRQTKSFSLVDSALKYFDEQASEVTAALLGNEHETANND